MATAAVSQTAFAKAGGIGFTPVYASTCVEGQHYFYPKIGPVLCKGVETMSVTGFGDVKTFVFEEINMRMPKLMRVPETKLKSSNIRELASEATLDAVLARLEGADGSGFFEGKSSGGGAVRLYEKMIAGDLDVLTELICKTYGCTKREIKVSTGGQYAERALCMIAAEYAIVKNLPYNDAYALFVEKSGKNGRAAAKSAESAPAEPVVSPNPL